MPPAFYLDWLQVAAEEGKHFTLVDTGCAPRTMPTRLPTYQGLRPCAKDRRRYRRPHGAGAAHPRSTRPDATPQIQHNQPRARRTPPPRCHSDTILHEEVGHVAIGNHWYRWLCLQHALILVALHLSDQALSSPWPATIEHRCPMAAGFTEEELSWLQMGPAPVAPPPVDLECPSGN